MRDERLTNLHERGAQLYCLKPSPNFEVLNGVALEHNDPRNTTKNTIV